MFIDHLARHVLGDLLEFTDQPLNIPAIPAAGTGAPAFLYVHIPFCEELCPYCSFHRVKYKAAKTTPYFDALREEIRHYHQLGYRFKEVYVGGGTPTVCLSALGETIDFIRELWPIDTVSVETNPDHLNTAVIDTLQSYRVNRLSVGVQSFDDRLLTAMERREKYGSGAAIAARLAEAADAFDTLNVDMIFNLPGQDRHSLARDIDTLLSANVSQVSWYPLMVADTTRRRMGKTMGLPSPARERELYEFIRGGLAPTHTASTVWTFSRQSDLIDEYIINQPEYIGTGSGAFSYLSGTIYSTSFSLNQYERLVARTGTGVTHARHYDHRAQLRYRLLMAFFGVRTERAGNAWLHELWPELSMLLLAGVIRRTPVGYELTDRGMYLWVVIMREFFTTVNNFRDQMRSFIKEDWNDNAAQPLRLQPVLDHSRTAG